MKLSPVFHLKLQHCSNRPHNSAISPSLLHGNVISASSTLFSRYYAVWNFAKLLELSTTTRSLNACSPCSSFPSVLLTEPLLLIWKKVSHWNLGANYPSPLQCNGFQLHGIWRRQHIWHGEASEAMEETLRDSIECYRCLGILNWASIQLGHLCQVWLLVLANCLSEHVKGEVE